MFFIRIIHGILSRGYEAHVIYPKPNVKEQLFVWAPDEQQRPGHF